jgi:hypothetical protein
MSPLSARQHAVLIRKRQHSGLGGKPPTVVYCQGNDNMQSGQQERRLA